MRTSHFYFTDELIATQLKAQPKEAPQGEYVSAGEWAKSQGLKVAIFLGLLLGLALLPFFTTL